MDWHVVIKDHYPEAVRTIRRLMPSALRRSHDAEDFVQQAVAQLIGNPIEYRGVSTLIALAKRRMIDATRRPRALVLEIDPSDGGRAAGQQCEADELQNRLLGRSRDSQERGLILLRCQGHTVAEIAELTGVGLRTVQRFFKHFKLAEEPF